MEKKWFIGIDISKKTLDVVIYNGNSKQLQSSDHKQIANGKEGYKDLIQWFKSRKMSLNQIVILMEHTGIYGFDICLFLEQRKIDYSMVSPIHINRSIGFVRGKNDKIDAFRLSDYCYTHRDKLVYTRLKNSTVIRLRELSAEYKRYVKQAAQHKSFLTDRKSREKTSTYQRAEITVRFLEEQIAGIIKQMDELIASDESFAQNYQLLISIKGVGPVNAINTLLHTNNFTSFDTARQYACYLGIAPFGRTSGTSLKGKPKVSKFGNRLLKADLTQAARSAVQWDTEIKAYYLRKEAEGKDFWVIMNAVKFKLLCRMFAVVSRGTPWADMKKYVN
jgi:transposase